MKDVGLRARSVFKIIDTMNGREFAQCLTPRGRFVFGNAEPVEGREAIAVAVDHFFSMIAGIHHEVAQVWGFDNVIITQFTVTYQRKDGSKVSFPGVTIWTLSEGLVDDYRIYLDHTPLFAQT